MSVLALLRHLAVGAAAVATLAACGGDGGGATGPATATVRLTNIANRPIFFAYFSRCDDPAWGEDRLGDATVSPGASFRWTDLAPGCYDFLAVTDDGRGSETFEVRLTAGQTYEWRPSEGSFVAPPSGALQVKRVPATLAPSY
jgi:hypothetical protein